jgi:hypothetical protein
MMRRIGGSAIDTSFRGVFGCPRRCRMCPVGEQFGIRSGVHARSACPGPEGLTVGCKGGPGTQDPGLFTCQNMSLSNLVTLVYHLDYYRLSAPDWMTPMLTVQYQRQDSSEQYEGTVRSHDAEASGRTVQTYGAPRKQRDGAVQSGGGEERAEIQRGC